MRRNSGRKHEQYAARQDRRDPAPPALRAPHGKPEASDADVRFGGELELGGTDIGRRVSRMGLPPRLILYPRNSKPCRTWTIRVFCGLMFTPSSFKTRPAAASAARASVADVQVITQSSAYLVS